MNIDWGFTFSVVIIGLVVVFCVLLVLVFICMLMGKIFMSIDKKKSDNDKAEQLKNVKPVGAVTAVPAPKPAPPAVIEDGISGETVAAISAALSCIFDGEKAVIKSIKRAAPRKHGARPVWNAAGVSSNTKPF